MRFLAASEIAQNGLSFCLQVRLYMWYNTWVCKKSLAKVILGSESHFGQIFQESSHWSQFPIETFAGPEAMDLEQDSHGFLVIFSKIADFIKL